MMGLKKRKSWEFPIVYLAAYYATHCLFPVVLCQIIGSSVVTSVSVVMNKEHQALKTPPVNFNLKTNSHQSRKDDRPPESHDNVHTVLSRLKTILEEQKNKNKPPVTPTVKSQPPKPTSTTASPPEIETTTLPEEYIVETTAKEDLIPETTLRDRSGIPENDEDDDNREYPERSGSAVTDAMKDFAKTVVSIPKTEEEADDEEEEEENRTVTSTSVEVHHAIHKLSGAILSPSRNSEEDHIEDILADVLTSINEARNSTEKTNDIKTMDNTKNKGNSDHLMKLKETAMMKNKETTMMKKPTMNNPTTTKKPMMQVMPTKETNKPMKKTTQPTMRPKPPMVETTHAHQKPPMSYSKVGLKPMRKPSYSDDRSEEPLIFESPDPLSKIPVPIINDFDDIEIDQENIQHDDDFEYSTLRPYVPPPKKTLLYFLAQREKNETTSSKRPQDFYDDEIFGFDPYQTFYHGVYVPEKKPGSAQSQQSEADRIEGQYFRPQKPVPMLPDHLHRPRPSHIQYQHGAAEHVDDSGLLNVQYEHPFAPDEYGISADQLLSMPRPPLPYDVRKNLTDHHDHHHLHQHGLGGGHGHGHHGAHGGAHGDHHGGGQGEHGGHHGHEGPQEKRPVFGPAPIGNPGLDATITKADPEMKQFVEINNRIALRLLSTVTNPISKATSHYNNMVISPFTIISSLAMLFLGARGPTAAQLDGLLRLDDMLGFNPHLMYSDVSKGFLSQPNTAAAMIRLLIADKNKGDVLDFFKMRVKHFYDARVEEADYKFAGHMAQSIINQMIRAQVQRHSYEILNSSLPLDGPLSLITAAFFDGQFQNAIRDRTVDHMNFIHLAALSRRLFEVPAVGFKGNLRAAYDLDLDATGVEIPYNTRDLSLILVMPGKPGEFAIGGVDSLKSRLTLHSWNSLMRGFYKRDSFKVIFPRFRHHTTANLSHTLQRFGLTNMFNSKQAKFKGINGLTDLYLDENVMHFAEFRTWEKLSDNYNEHSYNQESSNKNMDLVRILRPHVKEHYGKFGEPLSVTDWVFKSRHPSFGEQRGRQSPKIKDNINFNRNDYESQKRYEAALILAQELSRAEAKLRQDNNRDKDDTSKSYTNPPSYYYPANSYTRVRTSKTEFENENISLGNRERKVYSSFAHYRQEAEPRPDEDTVNTVLRFERPFLYFLRHNPTGMILMTGQYTEPVTEML